jgi:Xaa-Pro aminopeptidase
MELWNGARSGLEGACADFGADDAFPIGDIDDILPGLLENQSRVYYAMGYYSDFDQRMIGWVNRVRTRSKAGVSSPAEFVALDNVLHEMRLVKSKAEVRSMTRAVEISSNAHLRAMRNCRPGMTEFEVEAELNYEFMRGGSRRAAYPSIVAGGANACVLHYTENRDTLRDGELLLIDAGAEFDYYAADITRTFPVNGRFSKAQRAIYELVLEAQAAAIEQVYPGNHWNAPHEAAVQVLAEGMVALGLIKGRASTVIKKGRYRKFYVHRTGHWLGMDVHDVGDYKIGGEWRVLEPGMVMTVEPGLYVAAGDKQVARKWWNIGIRIEDDVLVTKDGNKVLTAAVPKAIDDIEAIVGQG